jgi:Glycosyltransferase Family 4/Glycosyl transferases group 1
MRKVTLISLHFPPSAASGAFRMLGFARHLPAFGWSTSVIAGAKVPYEPVDPGLQGDVPAGTPVRYVDYPNARVAGIGRRLLTLTGVLDPHVIWCYAARRTCDEWIAQERPDVVLTSGPPHGVHLLGRWLRRRHPVRLVTDFRDTWVKTEPVASRPVPRCAALERAMMQASDGIIANAPRALDAMAHAYPDCARKLVMVPNGFDPAPLATEVHRPDSSEPLTILHAGELYAGRDPRALLDAMGAAERSAPQAVPWHLRFVGRTAATGLDIVAEAERRQLRSRVSVEGQVSYDTAKDEMQRAGILLLVDGPGRHVGVPAKAYEYMGANRPILALAEPDGDTAWALEASGAVYRLAGAGDTVAIQRALVEISAIARAGAAGAPAHADSPFTRERLAGELAAFLEAVVAGRTGTTTS